MRPRALICASLLCLLSLSGCALFHRKVVPSKPGQPSALAVGTVTLVNEEEKFVLVDNGSLPVPPVGGVLKCYPAAASEPSAELIATDVRKRPFTIADINQGMPRKGDRVVYLPPELLNGKKPEIRRAVAVPAPKPHSSPGFQ